MTNQLQAILLQLTNCSNMNMLPIQRPLIICSCHHYFSVLKVFLSRRAAFCCLLVISNRIKETPLGCYIHACLNTKHQAKMQLGSFRAVSSWYLIAESHGTVKGMKKNAFQPHLWTSPPLQRRIFLVRDEGTQLPCPVSVHAPGTSGVLFQKR